MRTRLGYAGGMNTASPAAVSPPSETAEAPVPQSRACDVLLRLALSPADRVRLAEAAAAMGVRRSIWIRHAVFQTLNGRAWPVMLLPIEVAHSLGPVYRFRVNDAEHAEILAHMRQLPPEKARGLRTPSHWLTYVVRSALDSETPLDTWAVTEPTP